MWTTATFQFSTCWKWLSTLSTRGLQAECRRSTSRQRRTLTSNVGKWSLLSLKIVRLLTSYIWLVKENLLHVDCRLVDSMNAVRFCLWRIFLLFSTPSVCGGEQQAMITQPAIVLRLLPSATCQKFKALRHRYNDSGDKTWKQPWWTALSSVLKSLIYSFIMKIMHKMQSEYLNDTSNTEGAFLNREEHTEC